MTKYTQEQLLFLAYNYEEFDYQIEQLGEALIRMQQPNLGKYFTTSIYINQVFLDEIQDVGHQVNFTVDDDAYPAEQVKFPLSWLASDIEIVKFKYKPIADAIIKEREDSKIKEQRDCDLREFERLKQKLGR